MSNRAGQYGRENQRGYQPKTQRKFVPKASNSAPKDHQTPNPKLSTSLRQSSSSGAEAVDSSASSGSRVRLSDNGEWVSSRVQGDGSFVNYLPQDEAVAVGLGVEEGGLDPVESQRVVNLLNRELSRLLKLKPREFWREVAKDASLHDFLNSFLQFRSRWYDFPYHGSRETVAGVIIGDTDLSRRVFMVLYRISSHKDPGAQVADRLSSRDHEVLLQEKSLLDLPKLLDICAIYGRDNEELTKTLVLNSVKAQPGIHQKFGQMASHFLGIAWTMYQRCTSSLEVLISAGKCDDQASSQRKIEYLEVMDFMNDAISELDAFLIAYKPAAIYFSSPVEFSHGNEEMIIFLARLHDSLLPMLRQGLRLILGAKEETIGKSSSSSRADAYLSLKILSKRIVDFGWKLLDLCYLSDGVFEDELPIPTGAKIFPATVEDPMIRAEILIQTFKEVAGVSQQDQGNSYTGTLLPNIEKDFQVMHRIESLQNSGWILIDEEQLQYLAKMIRHPLMSVEPKALPPEKSGKIQTDEDMVIMESKISQIRDLFPDYGKGFLSACLEVYNHDPEEVIQRILEGTLHQDLQSLDPSMEVCPPKPKPSSAPSPSEGRKDKGKGILVDSEPISLPLDKQQSSKVIPPVGSSTSSSSFGRFVRKSNDIRLDQDVFNARDEKHLEKTQALISQYEYEDEYDDSFDDLGMSGVDSGFEESESLGDRLSSRMGVSTTRDRDSDSSAAPSASNKWGSRKKPQFYVKDGKNYSYKVEGSVAVANSNEAALVNQAQKEMIHGLGRGGNLPMGAVQKIEESNRAEGEDNDRSETASDGAQGGRGRGRGRGGGRRGGGGGNHFRKDRAMRKHMSGVGGF